MIITILICVDERFTSTIEIVIHKIKQIITIILSLCSADVKIALFRSYCTCFYCPFLWTHYKKSTHSKLRVAFNNVYRRILKLPPRSRASTMYAINHIDSFEVLLRKRIFGFTERLYNYENTIIKCINNSWVLRFDIWSPWNELIFI